MKKLFSAYLRSKPFLYAISKRSASRATKCQLTLIAFLVLAITIYNQFLISRTTNTTPWIVSDVISGDRFIVQRNDQNLEVKLCGISAEGSKDYLRSGEAWHCVVCRRQALRDRF